MRTYIPTKDNEKSISPISTRGNKRDQSVKICAKGDRIIRYNFSIKSNIPSCELGWMVPPTSRRHMTFGFGVPVAAHRNVTSLPSRTSISVLVESSRISGGTETMTTLQRQRVARLPRVPSANPV